MVKPVSLHLLLQIFFVQGLRQGQSCWRFLLHSQTVVSGTVSEIRILWNVTQPAQDTTSLWKVPSVLPIVAGHESDSSVRHLVSEGMNTESAAELHLACFSWSLAVDEGSASTLAHL